MIDFLRTHKSFTVSVVFTLIALKLLLYVMVTPPWIGPDETRHFSYAEALEREKRRLYADEVYIHPNQMPEGTNNLRHMNSSYAREYILKTPESYLDYEDVLPSGQPTWIVQHPPLYYASLSLTFFFREHLSVTNILMINRIITMVIFLSGLYFSFKFVHHIYGNSVAIISTILLSLWPVAAHTAAMLNNDILLFALGSLFFWLFSKWEKNLNYKRVILLSLILGLACYTKLLAFIISFYFGIWLMCQFFRKSITFKELILYGVILLIFSIPALWFAMENKLAYGSFTSSRLTPAVDTNSESYIDMFSFEGLKYAFSPKSINLMGNWLRNMVGLYGWGQADVHPSLRMAFYSVIVVCLAVGIKAKQFSMRTIKYMAPLISLFLIILYQNYLSIFAYDGWIRALSGRYFLFLTPPLFALISAPLWKIISHHKTLFYFFILIIFTIEIRLLIQEYLLWAYF